MVVAPKARRICSRPGAATSGLKCAKYWPPLIGAKPTVGTGLKASLVGTTKRKSGKLQVTYGGHPLYFFAQDKKAGDLNGQGFVHFGGSWWVVSAAGKKITVKP